MSFQQGLSGLNVTSKSLDVIGNNIANAGTYGSKVARAEFADMYANAMNGTGVAPIGIGVNLAAVAQQFAQGNLTSTSNPLDLAINGTGFFQVSNVVRDPTNLAAPPTLDGQMLYSRNGQFKLDAAGYLSNNQGQVLIGAAGQPIRAPTAGGQPAATTRVAIELNLDSRAEAPAVSPFDPARADSYNHATSLTTYDAMGTPSAVTFYFRRAADAGEWEVHAQRGAQTESLGTLQFDPATGTLGAPGGLSAFGVPLDFAGSTQYGTAFGVTSLTQDGRAPGQLLGISTSADGRMLARYSNGHAEVFGQIQLSNFRNPQGLQPVGGNAWQWAPAAGGITTNNPGQAGLGVLQAGALEESNIDLTAELVNMITAQRNYQANAQTIKTQDQVLQTAVNLR